MNHKKNGNNINLDLIMQNQNKQDEILSNGVQSLFNKDNDINDLPQDILYESLILSQIEKESQEKNIGNNDATSSTKEEISKEKVENNNNNNNNNKNMNENNESYYHDMLLAMDLQQAEHDNYQQRKAHDTLYNGKYSKVRETAPKINGDEIQFYYDIESIMKLNDNICIPTVIDNNNNNNNVSEISKDSKNKRKRNRRKNKKVDEVVNDASSTNVNTNVNANNENKDKSSTASSVIKRKSKHDPELWSMKHVERLKAYEAMGDVDHNEMHISNKAFNAIRNRLERKGFNKDPPEMSTI